MLKFLRNKLQLLTENQINLLTAILVLINIGIVVFWIGFWLSLPEATPTEIEQEFPLGEQVSEQFRSGNIGEIPEEEIEAKEIPPLPPVIFNTTGIISEVEPNKLLVQGSGSNFSDQKPRELTLTFIDSTTTFDPEQKIQYKGLEGLKHLKEGMKISIEGAENIRGKTEFKASGINILKK